MESVPTTPTTPPALTRGGLRALLGPVAVPGPLAGEVHEEVVQVHVVPGGHEFRVPQRELAYEFLRRRHPSPAVVEDDR